MVINTYACYEITADADEDIIPKLFEQKGENPIPSLRKVRFIGFETTAGTTIKINGQPNKVPSTGKFYTPYQNEQSCMDIYNLSFDEGCTALDIWVIF